VPAGPQGLVPGFAYRRRGASSYYGALRRTSHAKPEWTCADDHLTAIGATACARRELDRRVRAAGTVFSLLHCEPCDRWWPDGLATACPACGVPLERLKLVVTDRRPAVDGGNRPH
jgi:hypothetical protein